MSELPKPPAIYEEFIGRYPELGKAWELMGEAGGQGPLDPKTVRLIKLGIAIGAFREGAVRSGVRKATAAGATREEIEQVVALAASTIGLPGTVAAYSWTKKRSG